MQLPARKTLKSVGLSLIIIFAALIAIYRSMDRDIQTDYTPGVTFSRPYAQELGLDPEETLSAILDDLQVRQFRIPAYWSLLQPSKDKYDWEWLDNDLNAIADRDGKVTLAIGHKLPRWPECWTPTWALYYESNQMEFAVNDYLKAVVERYKDHPAVAEWQVENEPNFSFGICPKIRKGFIDEEITYVKSLDDTKPIATTDSGELTLWSLGGKVNNLGVSVYRVVITPIGIMSYWFMPPQFYVRKGQFVQWLFKTEKIYISEFQMEPWVKTTIPEATVAEQIKTFSVNQMRKNISYSKRMGIKRIDFWGVEWWYWMKVKQNNPEFWDLAKTIFQKK